MIILLIFFYFVKCKLIRLNAFILNFFIVIKNRHQNHLFQCLTNIYQKYKSSSTRSFQHLCKFKEMIGMIENI